MSITSNSFFEVVPESYVEGTVSQSSSELDSYCERAMEDGYTKSVVQSARDKAGDCSSYAAFEEIIEQVLNDMDEEEACEIRRRQNIKRSVDREISKLRDTDILATIDRQIHTTYKLTCITAVELVEECYNTFSSQMQEVYTECVYAVALCIKSDWVKQAIQNVMARWDSSMLLKDYISVFMKEHGANDENMNAQIRTLPNYLPDEYKNEPSPFMYKAYRAMTLLANRVRVPEGMDERILQQKSYYKSLLKSIESNTPLIGACTLATQEAAKELGCTVSYAYTVMLPYSDATSVSEALDAALGDDAYLFYNSLEEEQLQENEERLIEEIQAEPKVIVHDRQKEYADKKPAQQRQPVKKKPVKKSVDIAPYIPIWFCATFIHIVICTILLLFTKFFAMLSLLCLGAASVGWFARERGSDVGGKSPYLYIAGGYAGFVVCLILIIK